MKVRKCKACNKLYKEFKFSRKGACSAKCKRKLELESPIKKVDCKHCGKPFEIPVDGRRVTCSRECHKALAIKAATQQRIEQMELATLAEQRNQFADRPVRSYVQDREPRRQCPDCLRRVRLINSVAGAVWLRRHRDHAGNECTGSRLVVCYPMELATVGDDDE
jgi:hypothetical protein